MGPTASPSPLPRADAVGRAPHARRVPTGQRGNALVELLLVIFPYAMIFLGVTILGQLALGRLEAQKAAVYAGPTSGEQTEADIRDRYFLGMQDERHAIDFSEEENVALAQSYEDEEPILPFDSRDDIHAGFVRIENPRVVSEITVEDGEVVTTERVQRTRMGGYLNDFGIMSSEQATSEGREGDMATLLGDWLTYSRARVRYGYTYGGPSLPGEEAGTGRDLRQEFVLRGLDGEEGIVYYSATRTGQDHGSHQPHVDYVPLDELALLDLVEVTDESGGVVDVSVLDPASMPPPVLDSFGAAGADALFDIMSGLPDAP